VRVKRAFAFIALAGSLLGCAKKDDVIVKAGEGK
jgi:hypothetical protein